MSKNTHPISEHALSDLLHAAKLGDQKAFEELLQLYAPLIDSMTRQFVNTSSVAFDREDLRQEAILCFFHALMRYDPSREGVQFGLFAKQCIRNGLISCWRARQKGENTTLLEEELVSQPEDTEASPAEHLMAEESYLALYRLVSGELSEYENRIWWMYLAGRTAKEIAAQLKKDEKSVQNAIYRIRRKLRAVIPYSN